MDEEKNKTLLNITTAVRRQILSLTNAKKTGKYEIKIEVNLSQGGIGDAYLCSSSREKI